MNHAVKEDSARLFRELKPITAISNLIASYLWRILLEKPQDSDLNLTVETTADDQRKTKRTFWKLSAAVIVFEIMLLLTFLLLALGATVGHSKYHLPIANTLKYSAICLPLISWFCSLNGLSFGRIILVLASITLTIISAALFLL